MVIKMYGVRRLDRLGSLKSSRYAESDSERGKCVYLREVQDGEMSLTVMVPTMVYLTDALSQ